MIVEHLRRWAVAWSETSPAAVAEAPLDAAALRDLGRLDEALSAAEAAQRVARPAEAAGLALLCGELLAALDRAPEAEQRFQAALRLDPRLTDAHIQLGILRLNQGRNAEARADFERAVHLHRAGATARYYLAKACFALGEYPRAIAQLSIVRHLEPGYRPAVVLMGRAHAAVGHFRQAVAEFQAAIALKDEDPRVLAYLGLAQLGAGKPAEAIRNLSRAVELAPEDHGTRLQLAKVLERERRFEAATAA